MKILYLECNMGIAGDMLMAALWQLVDDKEKALNDIQSAGLPDTEIFFEEKTSCGICGAYANVLVKGKSEGQNHHSNTVPNVIKIIESLNFNEKIKEKSIETYNIIANAESKVHGTTVENIHFHEVGTLDAIADVVVCTYLIDILKIDKIVCSAINVGNGTVKCAHGILPVPAPATAEILKGIACYKSEIKSELCTPTGAAIVRANADEYGAMPKMICSNVGYGFGKKEFDTANCVRAFLGDADVDTIELACNIDDMTAEDLAYACEILMQNGALDVTQSPVYMKKSRLGTMMSVICNADDREKLTELIFRHTSTIGIREYELKRYTLERKISKINTPFGEIKTKKSSGYNTEKNKIEHDDIEKIARDNNLSVEEVRNLIKQQNPR